MFKAKNNGYYFKSEVNYPNNKSLVYQNVYLDKKLKITKVEVTDKDGKVQITMNFDKIVYNKNFSNDYFDLSKLIKTNDDKDDKNTTSSEKRENTNTNTTEENTTPNDDEKTEYNNDDSNSTTQDSNQTTTTNENDENLNENNTTTSDDTNVKTKETATIDDVIYPMYLPENTTLANKEVIKTDDGERLIMTFTGDNPFVLVEETISYQEDGLIVPVSGDLDFLTDVIGVINDNSVSWDSNGIDYYIVSNTLKTEELVNIARSISVLPVSK